jgi:hypothetical protein
LYRDALDVPPFLRREQLETIRNEARRRGDVHAEQLAGRRIDVLQQQMVLPTWRPFEEEDEPGVALEPVRELATLDPGMEEELASLVSLLSMMPDEAIVEFRKRRPKGMPAHLFDALLEIARSGEPTPLPGTAAAGRRRQIQKRVPDSDQSDLF